MLTNQVDSDYLARNQSSENIKDLERRKTRYENAEQGIIPKKPSVQQATEQHLHSEVSENNPIYINTMDNFEENYKHEANIKTKDNRFTQYEKQTHYKSKDSHRHNDFINQRLNNYFESSKDKRCIMLNDITKIHKVVLARKKRLKQIADKKECPIQIQKIDFAEQYEEYKDIEKPTDSIGGDFKPNIERIPRSRNIRSYYNTQKKQNSPLQKYNNDVKIQFKNMHPKTESEAKIVFNASIHPNLVLLINIVGLLLLLAEITFNHST